MAGQVTTAGDLTDALGGLGIQPSRPVIVHASLSAFGYFEGGAQAVVQALLACFERVIAPTFTYKTMLTPETGPPGNGITYGSGKDANRMAEFYRPDMPADRLMGCIPEALRQHPQAQRSMHPIQSFAGVNAGELLAGQALDDPLRPIGNALEMDGWVLLLGVDQRVNTSIHYGEKLAGRVQFVRWALTPQGVVECPGFPGCSDGFEAIMPYLDGVIHRGQAGLAHIQAMPLSALVDCVRRVIEADPLALLCERSYCGRCDAVRAKAI